MKNIDFNLSSKRDSGRDRITYEATFTESLMYPKFTIGSLNWSLN